MKIALFMAFFLAVSGAALAQEEVIVITLGPGEVLYPVHNVREFVHLYGSIIAPDKDVSIYGGFVYEGGYADVGGGLLIYNDQSGMSGGYLKAAGCMQFGHNPDYPWGTFVQSDGHLEVGFLALNNGIYELFGGSVYASEASLGDSEYSGFFHMNAGQAVIPNGISIYKGSSWLHGGKLTTANIDLGRHGWPPPYAVDSWLRLSGGADININRRLSVSSYSGIQADPGTEIHFVGTPPDSWRFADQPEKWGFHMESTRPAIMSGLANISMIFEGGSHWEAMFEVGGADLGAILEGFDNNFALGQLHVGSHVDSAHVKLIDAFDNQLSGLVEALYVNHLSVSNGATLDLNGLNLYCFSKDISDGAIILNGTVTLIPEPASAILLAFGGLLAMRRRKPTLK